MRWEVDLREREGCMWMDIRSFSAFQRPGPARSSSAAVLNALHISHVITCVSEAVVHSQHLILLCSPVPSIPASLNT